MRVFVTGASGWIGSAVVPELLGAGHEVTGLARSDASAAALTAAGAQVHRGSLDDPESLRSGAAASDGVIHLAFKHDVAFSGGFEAAAEADRRAVEIFGEVLAGSDRPLLIASGTLGVAPGRVATERDGHGPAPAVGIGAPARAPGRPPPSSRCPSPRAASARPSCGSRRRTTATGITASWPPWSASPAPRAPPAYIGDGANRWPAVHRLDSAHLFRLALENAPPGSTLHAVADEGVPIRAVAEVIGRHLDVPVVSIPPEQAAGHFTWLGGFIGLDAPASSALTRELLGWQPTQPGLLDDLDKGHYFEKPSA